MCEKEFRGEYQAGAVVRRYMRTAFNELGVGWTERKGLFESVFVVTATLDQHKRLNAWIAAVKEGS